VKIESMGYKITKYLLNCNGMTQMQVNKHLPAHEKQC